MHQLNPMFNCRNILTIFLITIALGLYGQWDANAGIAVPLTQNATSDASTMDNLAPLVLDGDQNTSWESDFAFPFPYLSQANRNILLNTPDSLFCSSMPKDSIFIDSMFTNTVQVDSFFIDSTLIDSVTYTTVQVDSIYYNNSTMMYDTVQVDSIIIDTIQVDSFFLDSILIDSMFLDTITININNIDTTDYGVITDGNPNTGSLSIPVAGNYSWVGITFDTLRPVLAISLKAFSQSDIDIYAYTSPNDSILVGTYVNGTDDYQLKRFLLEEDSVHQVKMWSESDINIFELGGLEEYPKESIVVDIGSSQPLGQIVTRYWAGFERAEASTLYISEDSLNWYELVNLDPDNSGVLAIEVDIDTTARYIRLEHSLALLDYGRVYVWEIGAYDATGIYAPYPAAKPGNQTLYEMLGMNTLWGWGHNQYTDLIPDGEGPAMFDTISSFARNYHFMDWDTPDPDTIPDYSNMATSGTYPQFYWLDWDREYQAWIDGGIEPHACIMFSHAFPASAWDSVDFASAYHYGYEFAKHFGPTQGNGKIKKMEIGNEPWFYESNDYRLLMSQMAQGIKDADQAMEVFPCALQAHDSITENSIIGLKNYIGTRITPADTINLDGVNLHAYCWDIDSLGHRVSTPPETKTNEFRSINSMIKWRDVNMPGKKVIVSEWGYDIDATNHPCTHSECVSERAGAVYTTRAALIMHRLGVDEATVFWFANADSSSSTTFNRSGILESKSNNFTPKNAFVAMTTLVDSLEHDYFHEVVQEDDDAYIYLYADSLGNPSHLVAWSPNDGDNTQEFSATYMNPDYVPLHATRVIGELKGGTPITKPTYADDTIHFTISSAPTIIRLVPNPCIDHISVTTSDTDNFYAADSTLSSNAVLPTSGAATIKYQAGQSVSLDPGFCSGDSTNLEVTIEECVVDSLLQN